MAILRVNLNLIVALHEAALQDPDQLLLGMILHCRDSLGKNRTQHYVANRSFS